MRLEDELKQGEFRNAKIKALLNIIFTASWLNIIQTQLLKDYNISWQQFNILRILKGSHPKVLSLKDISSRMIDRSSNTSRLVDKLEKKELVARVKSEIDRRKVDIRITKLGLKLVTSASAKLENGILDKLSFFTNEDAELLNELLEKFRSSEN